jgi:carbonic anhydrase
MRDDLQHCRLPALKTGRGRRATRQEPFAVILGCSDSRVPAEIIFDQGLGELFVIRVAGNIVGSSQIGSVEFAVERLGPRLVVVLGHSHCGAVRAAVHECGLGTECPSPHLHSIVDRIRPSVDRLLAAEYRPKPEHLLRLAVRSNIHASVQTLCEASTILQQMIQTEGLVVTGAEYAVETGRVDFLDETQ